MPAKLTFKNHWLVRYVAAVGAVGAGLVVRLGLTALVGEGLPTYITFYPVIMAVALLGGVGPGLVATLTTALAVDYWLLPPTHAFGIASVVDAVGLAFFTGTGVFMSVVAELYRRARQIAAVHDTELLRREGQGLSRQPLWETVLLVGGLVLVMGILGTVGWQTYRNLAVTVQAERWVSHSYVVDDELERLFTTLQDMEASERGYLIMGAEDYLHPYDTAKRAVAGQLASLMRLTGDNPGQVQRLKGIEALVDTKLAELKEVIEMRRSQGLEAARALMAKGKGQTVTEEIRKRLTEAEEEEQQLLYVRTASRDADLHKTLQALLAGGLLSLLLLMSVFGFLTQENSRRRRAEAELRRHQKDLQKTVAARTADLSQANESVNQQREWLRITLSSIGDAVLATDTAGHITFINPVAETLTGWQEKEVLGQPVQTVFRVINEETRAPGEDIVARVLREGRTVALANHTALIARDEREVPIEDSAAPIKDGAGTVSGVVLVFHDVTEKRRAQAALRETQRRNEMLASIIERTSQPFGMGYPDGRLGLINPAFEQLTGYSAQELRAMDWARTLTPPEWREIERQKLEELHSTGQPVRYEKEYLRKDGTRVPIELLVHLARDAEGKPIYYYSFLTDITARRQGESAIHQLNAELRQRLADFQAANEEVQASRRAALSLAEDALEARQEGERANAALQKANESLNTSRRAALNLMDDAVRARHQTEQASAELKKVNRILRVHSKNDQALMRAHGESDYLEAACRIVVEDCGHAMVWVGFAEDDEAEMVRPAAQAGFEEGYLETLRITWADTERGRGPTGTAIRTHQPSMCRNMQTDPGFAPWREEAIKRGYGSSLALPLLADGKAFGALTIYSSQPDGFSNDELTLLADLAGDLAYGITELRLRAAKERAEEALRQSEERYRGLVELSPEAVLVNRNDRIVLVNPAGLQLFGASSGEQLLGKSFFELFHADYHALKRERIGKMLAGHRTPVLEEKIVRLDGIAVDVEVAGAPVTDQGERAVLLLVRDITERKRAEAALQQTAAELERSNRDLEQFAYVASHDLQEPLRAVGGYVKLLQHRFPDKLDAKSRGYIAGAFEGATRMERLITDLLAFSRIGTRGGNFVHADLDAVLPQALGNLQAGIESARATITHDSLPTLCVDATQMMQLFQNLIGNALKFQGESPPRIHVGAQRQDGRWLFFVRDNGIGIEPQYFEKIFKVFQRLHTRTDYPGTGIGLAICKKIVERHGGTIWVESQLEQGSTFYFTIPEAAAR
jgi:PAS domain S-box-containing protein